MLRSEHVCHYFLVLDTALELPVNTYIFIEKPVIASITDSLLSIWNSEVIGSCGILHLCSNESFEERIL